MKKVLNWTIGSFFRTIARILAYLVVGFFLSLLFSKFGFTLKVSASTYNAFWLRDTNTIEVGGIYDCSSDSSCSEVSSQSSTFAINDNEVRATISNSSKLTIGPNGNVLNIGGYLLKKNYFYNITAYVCSSSNLSNTTALIYGASYKQWSNNNLYNNTSRNLLNGLAGQENTFNYCYQYSALVAPNGDLTQINLRIRTSSSISTYYYMMGVKVESLGIYTGAIEEIVDNSGFATASSVEDVKNATNEIKSEINSIDDSLNNSDTSGAQDDADSFFNNFDSGDTGSLMNLVKLPIKFLDSLNNSCSTIHINTGYIGEFNLPCLSSYLYNQSGFANIFNIISLVLNGTIMYGCIKRIITCVQKLKNPNDDDIEVIDL